MDEARIEQFRKMAEADPENELGHFSLGRAYLDAQRPWDAIGCFRRVIELNAQNSKAYQLLAETQRDVGDRAAAVATLKTGIEIAHQRGDLQPRNQMAAMLKELGEQPPSFEADNTARPTAAATPAGQVQCSRCNQSKAALPERPFKGELGEKVLASVCADCWREWIFMGTKVINELRLDFAIPQHAQMYDQHMMEFLNLR